MAPHARKELGRLEELLAIDRAPRCEREAKAAHKRAARKQRGGRVASGSRAALLSQVEPVPPAGVDRVARRLIVERRPGSKAGVCSYVRGVQAGGERRGSSVGCTPLRCSCATHRRC